ncbi:MAG: hypothetical protein ABI880_15930 [Acidobacteriota bacterium]
MPARAALAPGASKALEPREGAAPVRLDRYQRRFGGLGTIVTLENGRAFTAAHCLAKVDGTPGVILGVGARCWRVVKRWSPARLDLALLVAVDEQSARRNASVLRSDSPAAGSTVATVARVQVGSGVQLVGHTGRRFQTRAARVIAVTATTATAVVTHRTGVCGNDSGGPVLVDGVLVGIVTHRTGAAVSPQCSCQVVFTRLDSSQVRRLIRAAGAE